MALINCPECAREVSSTANACPNCGRPLSEPPPAITRKAVVTVPPKSRDFPNWIFIPIAVLGILVIFLMIALFRNNEQDADSRNVNVNIAARQTPVTLDTPVRIEPADSAVIPPPVETTGPVIPQTVPAQTQTDLDSMPGTVLLEAKVAVPTGTPQPVRDEKFYLLDRDLESILREAKIETVAGQNQVNSFGLSVLYPDRHPEIRTKALAAINRHIKYDTTTDAAGRANLRQVTPGSYHLFGITKTRNGFAVWSSPVAVSAGENRLVLEPARFTEVPE
jgi:hypothetical protein